jgi:hypothetical protein
MISFIHKIKNKSYRKQMSELIFFSFHPIFHTKFSIPWSKQFPPPPFKIRKNLNLHNSPFFGGQKTNKPFFFEKIL